MPTQARLIEDDRIAEVPVRGGQIKGALRERDEAKTTTAGAGRDAAEAATPAIREIENGRRVVTFAFGSTPSCGIRSTGSARSWDAS